MESVVLGTETENETGFELDSVVLMEFEIESVILVTFTVETVVLESFTVESVVLTGLDTDSVTVGVFKVDVEVALAVTETTCVVHPVVQVGHAPFSVSVLVFSHSHNLPGAVTVVVQSHGNCEGPLHFRAGHFFSGASVTVAV